VQVTVNPDPAGDMASSVRVGRQALVASVSGVIVALCDFPLVLPSTIARLAAVHGADHTAILIPCHAGQKGHPTLFPLVVLDELAAGGTLRDLVRRDPQRIRLLAVDDPGILQDMDTPEDYLAVREEVAARSLIQNEDDQRQQRQIEE
jgi:molybdenum cofactor cytidylyltransferase